MKLVNLTPHDVTLRLADGSDIVLPSVGEARVDTSSELGEVSGVPVPVSSPIKYGEVYGLPAPQEGVVYIVSLLVAQRAPRPDVWSPGTGPKDNAIRKDGKVVAVTRLIRSV